MNQMTTLPATVRKAVAPYAPDAPNMEARFLARMAGAGVVPQPRSEQLATSRRPAPKLPPSKPVVAERMQQILDVMKGPMKAGEIRAATGIEHRAMERALGRLLSFHMIGKLQDGPGLPATYHPKGWRKRK